MSAEAIQGTDKAAFVSDLIQSTASTLEKMLEASVGDVPHVPPNRLLARGLVINQLMLWSQREYGPGGVAILEDMYRDFCGRSEGDAA